MPMPFLGVSLPPAFSTSLCKKLAAHQNILSTNGVVCKRPIALSLLSKRKREIVRTIKIHRTTTKKQRVNKMGNRIPDMILFKLKSNVKPPFNFTPQKFPQRK